MSISPVLQTESSECGLACLVMVARAHGLMLDISEVRRRFSTGLRGVTLQTLINQSAELGFSARPLQLELHELSGLKLPCILHWDLTHFVVLERCTRTGVVVLDPAIGRRKLPLASVSQHFTGVALELVPSASFRAERDIPRLPLSALTGKVLGLKLSVAQILGVALALEIFAITAPLLNQLIVDDVLSSGDYDLLLVLVVGFALLLVAQTVIGMARSWMVVLLGQTLSLQWRGNIFSHLIRLPLSYFEKRHLGDITSRFSSVTAIQQTLTGAAIEAVLDGLMAIATLAMMLIYAPKLTLIVLAAVCMYAILRWAAFGPLRAASTERLIVAARENTHFIETLRAMSPIKLFGREQERRAYWQNLLVEIQNRDAITAKMSIGYTGAQGLIFGIENLAVLWMASQLILDSQANVSGAMTIGMLFAFISYKGQFTTRVAKLIDHFVSLRMLGMHTARLADIALEPPEVETHQSADLSHLPPTLELRNVSFRYGNGEPWILKSVNLRIDDGDSIAIVGPSGAGKTTLLKIALGLLEPTSGEVLFGGVPIRQLGLNNFRRQVGTVMQDDVLLSGSLAENISFFDVNASQDEIEECAKSAQIHLDVSTMPMGYQTMVGDLGTGLSGGQKQRLVLARALYKKPRLLALDEATSHLDLSNERAVTSALAALKLTRILIAHRPETVAAAKRVILLREGQLKDIPARPVEAPAMAA